MAPVPLLSVPAKSRTSIASASWVLLPPHQRSAMRTSKPLLRTSDSFKRSQRHPATFDTARACVPSHLARRACSGHLERCHDREANLRSVRASHVRGSGVARPAAWPLRNSRGLSCIARRPNREGWSSAVGVATWRHSVEEVPQRPARSGRLRLLLRGRFVRAANGMPHVEQHALHTMMMAGEHGRDQFAESSSDVDDALDTGEVDFRCDRSAIGRLSPTMARLNSSAAAASSMRWSKPPAPLPGLRGSFRFGRIRKAAPRDQGAGAAKLGPCRHRAGHVRTEQTANSVSSKRPSSCPTRC